MNTKLRGIGNWSHGSTGYGYRNSSAESKGPENTKPYAETNRYHALCLDDSNKLLSMSMDKVRQSAIDPARY